MCVCVIHMLEASLDCFSLSSISFQNLKELKKIFETGALFVVGGCDYFLLCAASIIIIDNFSMFRSSNATEVYYCRDYTEQDEGTDTETQINV